MSESVEDRWRALLEQNAPESREVDANSPLRMLVGVSPSGRPYFAVITKEKPTRPDLPSVIEVSVGRRNADGRWTLRLELRPQAQAFTDAFVSLLSGLAVKSAAVTAEKEALDLFLQTLAEWRELLVARIERLSESALRGLVAELWFGFISNRHGQDAGAAASAWAGPLGGSQDYQFPSPGHRYEVKSIRPNRVTIEISSEDQLDGGSVKLAVVTLEDCNPGYGVTLPELVKEIRSKLSVWERIEFDHRFVRLSVNLDDPWYSENAFSVLELRIYDVVPEFPAIRRSQLPKEISRASYRLDVQYLKEFLVVQLDYMHGSGDQNG